MPPRTGIAVVVAARAVNLAVLDLGESPVEQLSKGTAIVQAMEAMGGNLDWSEAKMYPCVVPDRGVSDQTMQTAVATLNSLVERSRPAKKKPWWKFW